jgi:hypothetical protein
VVSKKNRVYAESIPTIRNAFSSQTVVVTNAQMP